MDRARMFGRRFLTSRYFAWIVRGVQRIFGLPGVCHVMAMAPACMIGPMLRALGGRIGGTVNFTGSVRVVNARESFHNLEIFGPAWLGSGIVFDLSEEIRIEEGASIGWDVKLFTHFNTGTHNQLSQWFPAERGPLRIGPHCFISSQSLIFPGISLGARTMVGSNSLVRKSTPGDCVVLGTPARIIHRLEPRPPSVGGGAGIPPGTQPDPSDATDPGPA